MTIGERIRAARELRGWSQTKLGKEAGNISQQNIQRLEEGSVAHSRFLAPTLAALGLTDDGLPDPAKQVPKASEGDPLPALALEATLRNLGMPGTEAKAEAEAILGLIGRRIEPPIGLSIEAAVIRRLAAIVEKYKLKQEA